MPKSLRLKGLPRASAVVAAPSDTSPPLSARGPLLLELVARLFPRHSALRRYGPFFAPILAVLAYHAFIYYWLCDDAFISFRYSLNLATGHGLVFNRGEHVEGYTNFLWVLELGAILRVTGVRPEIAATVLSALCTAGSVAVTYVLAARTPFRRWRVAAAWLALALLAVNRNFAVWSTSGLETRQFTFFLLLAVAYLHRARLRRGNLVRASLALAAAALTRPEGTLLWLSCFGWYLLDGRLRGARASVRDWLRFALPFAVIVGAQYLFRRAYYHDWFPNTYYAKHLQAWPEAGIAYVTAVVCEGGLYVLLPLAALGLLARWAIRRDGLPLLTLCCVLPHLLYVVRIGGDHFEFRPFDFYWPLLAVALADGVLVFARLAERRASARALLAPRAELVAWAAGAAVFSTAVLYGSALQLAHYCLTYEKRSRDETHHLYAPVTDENFPAAFLLPGVGHVVPVYNHALDYLNHHTVGARRQEHWAFWQMLESQFGPYRGRVPAGLIPPDAVAATGSVGVYPYTFPELTVVDTLGLTDRVVARHGERLNRDRWMAHDRSPPPGYLEQRGVNLEIHPAARSLGAALLAAPYAVRLDDDLWMPLASKNEPWLVRAFGGRPLYHVELAAGAADPARNTAILAGRARRGVRALGVFDDANAAIQWTLEGSAMQPEPRFGSTPNQSGVSGNLGGFLDSFHPSQGDAATGTATSPEFDVAPGTDLVFLVGGGGEGRNVGVELLADGAVVARWSGRDSEQLALVHEDLTRFAGRRLRLRVFDRATGEWGHVLADHFVLLQ